MKDTQKNRNIVVMLIALAALIIVLAREYQTGADFVVGVLGQTKSTPTPKASKTPTGATASATASPTVTVVVSNTETATASATVAPPTMVMTPTPADTAVPGGAVAPFPSAPLCANHSTTEYHGLWNSEQACHFDHEHGQNPFTPQVALTFPGFNLRALLGDVGIGHTNLSSPMENTHKHGGFKWQVQLVPVNGCEGYESKPTGVNASAIQFHNYGDYSIEMEARVHTAAALFRQCKVSNPSDYGYVYLTQFMDYGQRVTPYQGSILAYPNNPDPAYDSPRGAYFTLDCFGVKPPPGVCRTSLQQVLNTNSNANSIWTSKDQGLLDNSILFDILFRIRDNYQLLEWADTAYPFTFGWLCSNDGGATYAAIPGCRYNNSARGIHEIAGDIPPAWDNLAGFDTDARQGRITADGYVTHFGDLNLACTAVGPDCHPIKLVAAFSGGYGSQLIDEKANQFSQAAQPEHDIYFCMNVQCVEGAEGAISSGWIGNQN